MENPGTEPRPILVVDDNANLRGALAGVLDHAGYQVFQAADGRSAIADTRQRPVALLITDQVMPDGERIGTIRHFVQEFPQIPIVAISGNPQYLPMVTALGAAVVLKKPIHLPTFYRLSVNLLARESA